jgi:iron complex transport system substrate-binding protein
MQIRSILASLTAFTAIISAPPCLADGAADRVGVLDDEGREVVLTAPAQRVVSLAPHLTENLFAVGAGEQVVGTTSFSDHPEAAAEIPRVGSYKRADMERIVAMQPDLVVAWASGNDRAQIERMIELGLTVYISEPRDFEGIATTLERLGQLTGHPDTGEEAATELREGSRALAERYRDAAPVTVFYQVWERPLMTINDEHLINEAISICGGDNVFGDLERLVPRIDRESVLKADPEAIAAGGMGEDRQDWLEAWREWPELQAVREENLFFIPPSLLQRHTPRVLQGTSQLCKQLDSVRRERQDDASR